MTQGFATPEAGGGQGGSPLRHEAGPSDSESRGPTQNLGRSVPGSLADWGDSEQ